MRFDVKQGLLAEAECDVLIVSVFEGATELTGATGEVDAASGGALKTLIEQEKFEGKLGEIADLTPSEDVKARRVVVVGLGRKEEFDCDKARKASSAAARKARDLSAKRVSTALSGEGADGLNPEAYAQALVEGTILGTYQFTKFKTADAKTNPIEEIAIIINDGGQVEAAKSGASRGEIIAQAKNFARDLTNEPANSLTPTVFAAKAQQIAEEAGLEYRVINRDEMKRIGMNLLLAVSKGSIEEPKFVILRYRAPKPAKTIALVGKGITFDSGGLNIKQGEGMADMKDDMTGAGVILATMKAISALKPNVNVVGSMPLTENMPGGNAMRPGDIIKALSGKTVEINNTDAEGRLILADGVAFAEREQADEIIDIATLTGACVVALGRQIAGVMGPSQEMIDKLIRSGKDSGEPLWQLPLVPEYKDSIKSEFADMKNSGGREAGTITATFFIKEHVTKNEWTHIDIAGPCNVDKETPLGPKGGTGFGVGLLINYLMSA